MRKRHIALLLIIIMMVSMLAGCGPEGKQQDPASHDGGTTKPFLPEGKTEGKLLSSADMGDYAGQWQDSPVVGSEYSERLALYADGTFYMGTSQMDGITRERFRCGTWSIEDGMLKLAVAERILWAGGAIEQDPAWVTEVISDPEVVLVNKPDNLEYELSAATTDTQVNGKRTFTAGDKQYWELADEPDSLRNDYEAEKAQSWSLTANDKPPIGCWEMTDRGDNRQYVMLDGVKTSIRADWRALEVAKDGSYAMWERDWQNGMWIVRCVTGKALTDGNYLLLTQLNERRYEGATFEGIALIGNNALTNRPCDIQKINEWDEEYIWFEGYESLGNFVDKLDRPPWSQAMIADALVNSQGSSQTGNDITVPPTMSSDDRYDMFIAYAGIVESNHDIMVLPDNYLSMEEFRESEGLDIGDGKVAVCDITGDNVPELLYLTHNQGINELLHIWTWNGSKAVKVFEQRIRSLAGGGGNYSVFVSVKGELLVYVSMNGDGYYYGFWNVSKYLSTGKFNPEPYSFIENEGEAELFVLASSEDLDNPSYTRKGGKIKKTEATAWLEDWVASLDTVLMDSTESEYVDYDGTVHDIGLYSESWGPWPVYVMYPYGEQCMDWEFALTSLRGDQG